MIKLAWLWLMNHIPAYDQLEKKRKEGINLNECEVMTREPLVNP